MAVKLLRLEITAAPSGSGEGLCFLFLPRRPMPRKPLPLPQLDAVSEAGVAGCVTDGGANAVSGRSVSADSRSRSGTLLFVLSKYKIRLLTYHRKFHTKSRAFAKVMCAMIFERMFQSF